MTIRTRLKRLENRAKRPAPEENDRHRREVVARTLDRLPLEALKLMREAFDKYKVRAEKAGGPEAPVTFGALDLPEDFRRQLSACLRRRESVAAGSQGAPSLGPEPIARVTPNDCS
jgi:hypothetical protein